MPLANSSLITRREHMAQNQSSHTNAWQRPFVNIFKHFGVSEWKKCTCVGDVNLVMDKTLRVNTYRLRGSVPASNYIQFPKISSQSIGLTGRFFYLQYRPVREKPFVLHLEAAVNGGVIIRISFSNLYKEFRATSTWLQFPVADAPLQWTLFVLDMTTLLSLYLNRRFVYVKFIKICANMDIRGIYTSDNLYDETNLPREMRMFTPKNKNWHDVYALIQFPVDEFGAKDVPLYRNVKSHSPSESKVTLAHRRQPQTVLHREKTQGAAVLRHYTPTTLDERSISYIPGGAESFPVVGAPDMHINQASGLAKIQNEANFLDIHRKRATSKLYNVHQYHSTQEKKVNKQQQRTKGDVVKLSGDASLLKTEFVGQSGHFKPHTFSHSLNRSEKINTPSLIVDLDIESFDDANEEDSIPRNSSHFSLTRNHSNRVDQSEKLPQAQNDSKETRPAKSLPNLNLQKQKISQNHEALSKRTIDVDNSHLNNGQQGLGCDPHVKVHSFTDKELGVSQEQPMIRTRQEVDDEQCRHKFFPKNQKQEQDVPQHAQSGRFVPLSLDAIVSLSSDCVDCVHWVSRTVIGSWKHFFVYASPTNLILHNWINNDQVISIPALKTISGASNYIYTQLSSSRTGCIIASVLTSQKEKESILTLWTVTPKSLTTMWTKRFSQIVGGMDLDASGKSFVVVQTPYLRTSVSLYDDGPQKWKRSVSAMTAPNFVVEINKRRRKLDWPNLFRFKTEAHIRRIRFFPHDSTRLLSCGHDNIRIWRVKRGSLRCCPIDLRKHHANNIEFTDIAFPPLERDEARAFVTASKGMFFILKLNNLTISSVLNLHPITATMTCITASPEGCITSDSEGRIRTWDYSFDDFKLEVVHSSAIQSLNSDAHMRCLCSVRDGTLGIFFPEEKQYETIVRVHRQIKTMATHRNDHIFATASEDGDIRIWDLDTVKQLDKFQAVHDVPSSMSFHSSQRILFVGFLSGQIHVFDLNSKQQLCVLSNHTGPVQSLSTSIDNDRLYSLALDARIVVVLMTSWEVVQTIEFSCNLQSPSRMMLSTDNRLLIMTGPEPGVVSVLDAFSLETILHTELSFRNEPTKRSYTAMLVALDSKSEHIWTVTSNGSLLKLRVDTGHIVFKALCTKGESVHSLHIVEEKGYVLVLTDTMWLGWYLNDQRQKEPAFMIRCHSKRLLTSVWSSVTSRLIAGGEDGAYVWSLNDQSLSKQVDQQLEVNCSQLERKNFPDASQYHGSMQVETKATRGDGLESKILQETPFQSTSTSSPDSLKLPEVSKEDQNRKSPALKSINDDDDDGSGDDDKDSSASSNGTYVVQQSTDVDSREKMQTPIEKINTSFEKRKESFENMNPNVSANIQRSNVSEFVPKDVSKDISSREESSQQNQIDFQHSVMRDRGGDDVLEVAIVHEMESRKPPLLITHSQSRTVWAPVPSKIYTTPPDQAGLHLLQAIGSNFNGGACVQWHASTGTLIFACGTCLIIEDVETRKQSHFTGHKTEVSTIAVSQDGAFVASASGRYKGIERSEIKIWDTVQKNCKHTMQYHLSAVTSMAFSQDDRLLLSLGHYQDPSLCLWDINTGNLMCTTHLDVPCHSIAWDLRVYNEFACVGDDDALFFFFFDDTKEEFAFNVYRTGLYASTVIDRRKEGRASVPYQKELPACTCLAYTSHGILLVGHADGNVSAWNTKDNSHAMSWKVTTSCLTRIHVAGPMVMTCDTKGTALLFRLDNSNQGTLTLQGELSVNNAIVASSTDDVLGMAMVTTTEGISWVLHWHELAAVRLGSCHTSTIRGLSLASCGSFFATSGDDGSVRVWNGQTPEQIMQFQVADERLAATCVSLSPDTKNCAAGYNNGVIRLFNLESVKLEAKLAPHDAKVTEVMFSLDGRVIISSSRSGRIVVSSVSTGMTLRSIIDHRGSPVTCLTATSRASQLKTDISELWLACSLDRRISIWNARWTEDQNDLIEWLTLAAPTFAQTEDMQEQPPTLAKFSPIDPELVVFTCYTTQKQLNFYSLRLRTIVRRVRLQQFAWSLDISPKGSLVCIGTADRLVKIIDYNQGSFQDFVGHGDVVRIVRFCNSGETLFSTSHNCLLKWKAYM